jgi:hypothetical protein
MCITIATLTRINIRKLTSANLLKMQRKNLTIPSITKASTDRICVNITPATAPPTKVYTTT